MSEAPRIDKLIGKKVLTKMIDCHPETIFRWEQRGEFPKRMRVNGRVFWSLREILDWIEQVKSKRETLPPVPPSRISRKMIEARRSAPRVMKPLRFAS
jgi:predicted DNA-binding transcriptional regulator AlpA